MAISATVVPGKVFTETDAITHTTLNQLGTPTVDIAGAVGSLSIESNSITNAHIQADTGILLSKLEQGSGDAQIAITNSSNSNAYATQTVTGDVTITNAGVTAIGSEKVTTGMLEGDITEAKLIAAVTAKLLPPGVITPYVKSDAEPTGWKYCDGQHYDSTDAAYTALYDIIGYGYGRTDSAGADDASGTYFKVPDLRGRVPVGVDGAAGRLAADDTLAAAGGSESVTLTQNQIPAHTHSNSLTNGATTSTVTNVEENPWRNDCMSITGGGETNAHRKVSVWNGTDCVEVTGYAHQDAADNKTWSESFTVSNTSNVSITNGNNSTTGASVNLTQPYQVVEYIIKL